MNAYRGWLEVEDRRSREAMERARWLGWMILSPNLPEKNRVKTIFPWEEKTYHRPQLTSEQIASLSEKMDRVAEWRAVDFTELQIIAHGDY